MPAEKLTVENYLQEAEPSLIKLKDRLKDRTLVVSDVLDAEGNQYVNLVQEGGGVLGVALLGYTYVLEQMGIRFMKMAGTSAGAINTMMMTCLGKRNEAKSVKTLKILADKDLFDFVDGSSYVRGLIKRLVTSSGGYLKRLLLVFTIISVVFLASFLFLIYELGTKGFGTGFYVAIGLMAISGGLLAAAVFWVLAKRREFFRADFGLNPGQAFYDWVEGILTDCGIKNLDDLRKHVESVPEGGFHLRSNREPEPLDDINNPKLEDFLVIVTSDVTNQMKVEFPRHWKLYWNNSSEVRPASFVRASMAVPVFFKPFIVEKIDSAAVARYWQLIGVDNPELIPVESRFVDGGMISNFPINVFYNPKVAEPRLPTFGILLEDEDVVPPRTDYKSFFSFVGAMFNTVRYNYDKEFLIKHADWNRTVGKIDVRGVNWLNFNLTNEEKLLLFRKGAEAAAAFLLGESTGVPSAPAQGPQFRQISSRSAASPETVTDRSADADLESFAPEPVVGFNWQGYKAQRKTMKENLENLDNVL